MRRQTGKRKRNGQHSHLFTLAAIALSLSAQLPANSQIYLSPNQQYPQRPRGSLDLGGGVRCTFEGGASPSLSFSVGAYPDMLMNDVVVSKSFSSTASQSSLFALMTLNIPLGQKNHQFSCAELMQDVQLRTRIQSLRELADENIISESQYKKALLEAYQKFLGKDAASKSAKAEVSAEAGIQLQLSDNK